MVQSSEAKGSFWNIFSVDLGDTILSNARETLPSNKKKPLIFSKYFPFFPLVHINVASQEDVSIDFVVGLPRSQ